MIKKIRHHLTCSLRKLLFWFMKNFIRDFSFMIKEHSWFEENKILQLYYVDIFNGEWYVSFGWKKIGIPIHKIKGDIYIGKFPGGNMWKRLFSNLYVCWGRGNK